LSAGYRDDPLQRPPRSSVLAARTSRLSACCPGPGSGATCPDAGGSWRFAGHAGASGARVVEPHPPRWSAVTGELSRVGPAIIW